ncbi:MAG: conjugal transfer protein TraG, partial [Flavobacterium sp.]
SKISTLTQGMFVGAVSDNFDERIEQKIFHSEIVVDNERVAAETKKYQKIPEILSFKDEFGMDNMKAEIDSNYRRIKMDVIKIIEDEQERISNDPNLQHLIKDR